VRAPDLRAAAEAALAHEVSVALVEQPYRVAGRRSPAPANHLDEAWIAVVSRLRARRLRGLPLIVGGRSSGARVACRTAAQTGAAGVLCLAFPLDPPGRKSPAPTRLPELEGVSVPILIVQGSRDPFGMPSPSPGREVLAVAGDHSLRSSSAAVTLAVADWLERLPALSAQRSAGAAAVRRQGLA